MNKEYNMPEMFYLANNICELLDDEILDAMGIDLREQVTTDINSRSEWLSRNDEWMKLVAQVIEEKTYPWPKASNIKFPLISTAAIQFHARAFPSLLGTNRPIRCRVIGRDKQNLKAERAERLSTFLSFQLTEGMEDWVGDMDRLLFILPIIGSLYKKTYYSEQKRSIVSDLIMPRDLIINYDANEIKTARKTHRLWKLPNVITEMQNRGLYREVAEGDEKEPISPSKVANEVRDAVHGLNNSGETGDYSLQELYEVHCLLDLDEDGYKEPYVVTLRESDGKIYRIVANYGDEDIERNGDKIIAIEPKDFFTHYFFLPDPESKTHGIGFGTMIGPINNAVNSIINILTDAGHMHSLGGGFMARGVRLKNGATKFRPGEYKQVNTSGDDLRKGIFPLPTKEPSTVLFQMLGMLIDSGKDLSSVQDQMVGKSPGQNTPFSTTQAVMEQGMKVFNGIYKRIYRSMTSEFKKIYSLNKEFPDVGMYMNVLDMDGMDVDEAAKSPSALTGKPRGIEGVLQFLGEDFNTEDLDAVPTAEPDMIAEIQKIQKAMSLMEKMSQGIPLNVQEVTRRTLEAEGHEDIEILMEVPPPQLPPDVQLEQEKFQWLKQKETLQLRSTQLLDMAKVAQLKAQSELAYAQAQNEDVKGLHAQFMAEQKSIQDEYSNVTQRLKVLIDGQTRYDSKQSKGSAGGDNTGGSQ